MNLRVHHEVEQLGDVCSQLPTIDNVVDHSVFKEKLRSLKIFRQLLTNRLFDNSRTSESDQCFWLSDDDITKHRKTRGDAPSGWIGQNGNERQSSFVERSKCGGDLGHLHQRQRAFLHTRATGGREDDDCVSFFQRPLNQPSYFLADC